MQKQVTIQKYCYDIVKEKEPSFEGSLFLTPYTKRLNGIGYDKVILHDIYPYQTYKIPPLTSHNLLVLERLSTLPYSYIGNQLLLIDEMLLMYMNMGTSENFIDICLR